MPVNWIPLLVPEADYLELAAIVASRTRERGEEHAFLPVVAAPSSEESANTSTALSYANAGVAELVAWSIEDLRRLARSEAVTAQRWARAMDACTERVGEYLSTQEVAAMTGMTINEWRDAPRKITRHLATHYPDNPGWPLAVRSGRRLGHSYDQAYWAISEEQAKRWREVRAEAS